MARTWYRTRVRLLPVLLRLLLCVTLIANGVGVAFASARMSAAHAHDGVAASAQPHAMAGCHEQADAADDSAACHRHPSATAHDGMAGGPGGDACCDDGSACACPCAQHAPVALTAAAATAPEQPRPAPGGFAPEAHRPPVLPDEIRPPIA